MINIDDLFKQRLGGGDEDERPIAWLHMQELLDKEMPVGGIAAAGVNWRRMMSMAAGILLLACIGLGGYEMSSSMRVSGINSTSSGILSSSTGNGGGYNDNADNNKVAVSSAITAKQTPHQSDKLNKTDINFKSSKANNDKTTATKTNNIAANNIAAGYTANEVARKHTDNSISNKKTSDKNEHAINSTSSKGARLLASSEKHPRLRSKHPALFVNNAKHQYTASGTIESAAGKTTKKIPNVSGHPSSRTERIFADAMKSGKHQSPVAIRHKQLISRLSSADKAVVKAGKAHRLAKSFKRKTHTTDADYAANSSADGKTGKRRNRKADDNKIAGNSVITPASSVPNAKVPGGINNPDTKKVDNTYVRHTENIRQINIVMRYSMHTGLYTLDTTDIINITKESIEPIPYIPPIETVAMMKKERRHHRHKKSGFDQNMFAAGKQSPAQPTTQADNNANDNSATSKTVAKRKGNGWSLAKLDDAIQNMKYGLTHAQLAGGVLGGINSTFFGNTTTGGFHFGATGAVIFSDRWSVVSELKYFQRFNNGAFSDNYRTNDILQSYPTPNQVAYYVQVYNMKHGYNYSSVSSMELPIALKFSYHNFNIMGGVNFVYNFPINADGYNNKTSETGPSWYYNTLPATTSPQVYYNDFGSRFGIGYLVGVSYNINPGMSFDLRMTQTMSDNSKTVGEKIISNALYKSPSAQLSFIYFFNQMKK